MGKKNKKIKRENTHRHFTAKHSDDARALQDLSLFGTLPEGEPDWLPGSLLSFGVTAGREVGGGTSAWGELSRTVKSAGGKSRPTMLI